MNDEDAVAPLL